MKAGKKLLIGVAITAVISACIAADWLITEATKRPLEAYAVWWTADLVIEHMEKGE
ncbi:MAG: hypothetical protein ACO1QB_14150 [Verrucomicrobiales bacterium]